jgi:hypothetical protein
MLVDHIADELTEEEAILLEQHLAECAGCTEEERHLRQAIEATTPKLDSEIREGIENQLLAVLRERVSAAAPGGGKENPGRVARGRVNLAHRVSRLRSFVRMLRYPMPSYATVVLLIAAVATGFWMGRSDRSDSRAHSSEEPIRPAIRQPIQDTDALEDALAVFQIPSDDSLAGSSSGLRQGRIAMRFSTTPSDAIGMWSGSLRDTL